MKSRITFTLIYFLISGLIASVSVLSQSLDINLHGVKQPVLSLNGTWKLNETPDERSLTDKNFSRWKDIQVPGEIQMQGFRIKHDEPVLYKNQITIPRDFTGKKIILRFDGVYSYARLWINGNYVRDHHGGFSRWENDITRWVNPGRPCVITLEVTDMKDEISYGSGYAKHQIGGILKDVTLYALPKNHLADFYIETDMDSEYKDAMLKLSFNSMQTESATVLFTLTDPEGREVPISGNTIGLDSGESKKELLINVSDPLKWDAEHPNLYTLDVSLSVAGKVVYSFMERIGFRKVEIRENEMLVNGKPVKLRGANRHEIHPTLGRIATEEYDKLDVLLAKEANMNFIRTSHYPPTERFLQYCDEYGIYVESETAVCFVDTHRDPPYSALERETQNNPEYEGHYLSQLEEMVSSFRNRPSVVIWSIGNENIYGTNFQKSYDYVKREDPTRPVIFSYPGTGPSSGKYYEIMSIHYPTVEGNKKDQRNYYQNIFDFELEEMPALFDEWALVSCLNNETLRLDPNIRNFWGQSLDMMWSNLFETKGGLGGAIWGMVDETFMVPESTPGFREWWGVNYPQSIPAEYQGPGVGYGEWGIIDIWRRRKPEFWSAKKAYSPVRMLQTDVKAFVPGAEIFLPVYNRYNHTNLDELEIHIDYQGERTVIPGPDISPRIRGMIVIPAQNWKPNDTFIIEFHDKKTGSVIDMEKISLVGERESARLRKSINKDIYVEESGSHFIIKGKDFIFPVNRFTGLVENVVFSGQTVINSGPYVNASLVNKGFTRNSAYTENLANAGDWRADNVTYSKQEDKVVIRIHGTYQNAVSNIIMKIDADANLTVDFAFNGQFDRISHELGLSFVLNSEVFDALEWDKKSHWTVYPENHLGSRQGKIQLYSNLPPMKYRQHPEREWSFDDKNFYYFGLKGNDVDKPLINLAKAMKENIGEYTLFSNKSNLKLSVVSEDHSLACRLMKSSEDDLVLNVNTFWDYPELGWGNYSKDQPFTPFAGRINLIFK